MFPLDHPSFLQWLTSLPEHQRPVQVKVLPSRRQWLTGIDVKPRSCHSVHLDSRPLPFSPLAPWCASVPLWPTLVPIRNPVQFSIDSFRLGLPTPLAGVHPTISSVRRSTAKTFISIDASYHFSYPALYYLLLSVIY